LEGIEIFGEKGKNKWKESRSLEGRILEASFS
jgi:hypothetical protein